MSWSGPSNALPIGRYKLNAFDTELTINSITAADEGDYICTASNTQGHIAHTLQMRVEGLYYKTCFSGFYFGFLLTCFGCRYLSLHGCLYYIIYNSHVYWLYIDIPHLLKREKQRRPEVNSSHTTLGLKITLDIEEQLSSLSEADRDVAGAHGVSTIGGNRLRIT